MMGKRCFISEIIFLLFLCCSCGKAGEKERGKVFSEAVAVYEGESYAVGIDRPIHMAFTEGDIRGTERRLRIYFGE